ncbi:MAG: YqiA/YcfP family alpha/beta fold hydrolase [Candidatus Thermoplasmatota archaeon]|nr:YqiA/YcfP family alpha/beta fold hydrolase [Candidatus Thermoplasmatota archaeon]
MLYYIHGYLSSPTGSKASIFKKELGAIPVNYRFVPAEELVIDDCLSEIKKVIDTDDAVTLIGSSLGGCLAGKLARDLPDQINHLILLNPAVIPPDIDLNLIRDMPLRILKDMKDDRLFSKKLDVRITIFSATNDTVVPPRWVIQFAQFQEATVQFLHDDHRFSRNLSRLPELIKLFM